MGILMSFGFIISCLLWSE